GLLAGPRDRRPHRPVRHRHHHGRHERRRARRRSEGHHRRRREPLQAGIRPFGAGAVERARPRHAARARRAVAHRTMKVTIATRIFGPEVSAASAILRIWAEEFRDRGHEVTVLTARPPRGAAIDDPHGIEVRRARVKRDRQQYVRGYLSYMSFDIPLAFRLLFARRSDLYIVEPPPTTVAVVRVIAALRRTPYVVRAADYWTEAAELVTQNPLIIGTLRRL